MLLDSLYLMGKGKGQFSPCRKHPMPKICLIKFSGTGTHIECLRYFKTRTSECRQVATLGASCDFSESKVWLYIS